MANISILSRMVNGVQRNVDLSTNALIVGSLTVGGSGGTSLTQTILNTLIAFPGQIAATTAGSAGSTLVGDNNSYSNITPATATVKGALAALDAAVGSAAKAIDSTFNIQNSTDSTKKINFSAASITTGNTRTITMPDSNVNLGLVLSAVQQNGSTPFLAAQSMGGFKLTNLAPGTAGTDAINLNQLQNVQSGTQWRPEVNLFDSVDTTLPATTATQIDGVTVTNGMRVLFVALSSNNNQVYSAAVSGSAITWTAVMDNSRASAAPVQGDSILVLSGTNYSESAWNYNGTAWVQFNGAGQIQAGNGLSKTGNTLTVVAAAGSALSVGAGGLAVVTSATGGIQVASSALSLLLADTSLATSGSGVRVNLATLSGLTVSSGLKVVVDGATIAINAGTQALYVPNSGITNTQIAANVFDQVTIAGGAGAAAAVQYAPALKITGIAGQAFSANTTYAVRWGLVANGETAGRLYAADYNTASYDLFWVVGMFNSATAISAGGTITVTARGALTLGSSDTVFASGDQGRPVYLAGSGSFAPYSTQTSTSGYASAKVGMAESASVIWVDFQMMGVN